MAGIFQRQMVWVLLLNCLLVFSVQATGSGLSTVVVVNQSSSNSCELGNYFREHRYVPPENVLRIHWSGTNTLWSSNEFQTVLLTPLLDMLIARQLTNQIDYVVLSMDIPFQTSFGSVINGTTTALFYGLKSASGIENSYASSEAVFNQAKPASANGFSFLTTMITAGSLSQAKQLVDQGIASDSTFPSQPVILAKSSDPARNIRHTLFDNAIFNAKVLGVSTILRTNADSLWGQTNLLGFETGLSQWSVPSDMFVPGAIADSMTSYGGVIFGPNSQTNLLAFIGAGAAGSYGTVAEPLTDKEKFPNPQVYFYQARGFSLAESYYQSINAPFLGLTIGEPLAAPFAQAGWGAWNTNLPNSVLSNNSMLSVHFVASDANHPLQQVDLFVDGKFFTTVTNLPPRPGNLLTVTLNGYPITYTVLTNETLSTIATNLATLVNLPVTTSATKVTASVYGDRVELKSVAADSSTVPFYVVDATPTNTPGLSYRANSLPDSFPPRMIPFGLDKSGGFKMEVEIPSTLPYAILASTNLMDWTSIRTNDVPGLLDFVDVDAVNFPKRFYRMSSPDPDEPPDLSTPGFSDGAFQIHVKSVSGLPCAVQVSTNLLDWSPIFTNGYGGDMDFVDYDATNCACRFYRALIMPPAPPAYTVLNETGVTLVRVDTAIRPYIVEISTNTGQWTILSTNFNLDKIQTTTSSALGDADVISTFLRASRAEFLASEAFGYRTYTVSGSGPTNGAWVRMTITKTNGQSVVVGVTNLPGGATTTDMAIQLYALINVDSALQDSDGVVAEDFTVVSPTSIKFNLRARNSGFQAAAISVFSQRSGGSGLVISDSFTLKTLTNNITDLQSRNHLYVTAGAHSLDLNFPLETTNLIDGYHELTAVAYEGSHVRTQTRVKVPVVIQNSSLSATLTLLDLTNTAPVLGTYHIEVAANTNDVSVTTLYSTGGALAVATNQPTATFEVYGTNLWAGLHPFYAIVETDSGFKYRTQTRWVRLVSE